MQYPVYEISFNEDEDLGMTAISFVDYPAICNNFVWYGKGEQAEMPALYLNREKHEVVSPILIPNQLILRISPDGQKYYIRWSRETIERVAKRYLMNQYNNNFTYQHQWFNTQEGDYEESFLTGVYMLEMWTIDDAKNDRANKVYGYHLPEGTLMVRLKIHSNKLWQKIKSGEVKGLSIEAFIPIVEAGKVSYSKNKNKTDKKNMKNPKELFNAFMLWYNQVSEEAKELADVAATDETESGEVSLKYYTSDTDFIEIASDGTAKASDGSEVQDGEYPLADGNILVIENGKFKETKTVEETDEPEPVEAPIAEECGDEEKKEEETQEVEDEEDKTEGDTESDTEENPDEEKQDEVEAPYTLVEIEIAGETFNVPQEVADYIRHLEDAAVAGENFRKELAKLQSVTPSTKPVGNVVKQEKAGDEKANVADVSSLIANMNKKLK